MAFFYGKVPMVHDDVETLKHSYTLLDYIAKVVRDCQIEQLAQAAQMRRIEGRIDKLEQRMDKIESKLDLIIAHLGIGK